MNYDWNWFFSAFAQSCAALIAIIAGFTISAYINERGKCDSFISELKSLLIDRKELIANIKQRKVLWFNEITIYFDPMLKENIKTGIFNEIDDSQKLELLYKIVPELYSADKENLELLNERIRFRLDKRSFHWSDILLNNIGTKERLTIRVEEKERIEKLSEMSKALIELFKKSKSDLMSIQKRAKNMKIVPVTLIFALIIGVIIPLCVLPLPENQNLNLTININEILNSCINIKGALLMLTAFVFGYLFMNFYSRFNKIKKSAQEEVKRIKDEFLKIEYYSEYFKTRNQ
jgi:hypothetical protein